jgi:hypothetical protein
MIALITSDQGNTIRHNHHECIIIITSDASAPREGDDDVFTSGLHVISASAENLDDAEASFHHVRGGQQVPE